MMRIFFGALIAVVLVGCGTRKDQPSQSSGLDWQAISDQLLRRSNLQPGERVLLVGTPGRFDSLVLLLENKISKVGGLYLGAISVDTLNWPTNWKTDFVQSVVGKSRADLVALFGDVDLGIMLPGAGAGDLSYAALQDVLNMGKGRTIHFHWSGAYDMSGQPMDIDGRADTLYQRVLLETDYQRLTLIQKEFESAARQFGVSVTTPAGTNLTMKLGERPVTRQDGDASLARTQFARNLIDRELELPAGAIRVAPMEESVDGTIAFPDGSWNNQKVEGLVLTVRKGKITDIKARVGAEAVKAELDNAPEAGYSFREIAVGFNPLLAIPESNPWIPYYGYGAGVVRLSLGNNIELGGIVSGNYVRWNFFTDATVTIGDDVWIKDGKLMK